MAEILSHPNRYRDPAKAIFHFQRGDIMIRTRDGRPLTPDLANLLLDMAKQIFINEELYS